MALNANQLYSATSTAAAKRFWPTSLQPKTFDGVGGAPLLAQLTPVYKDPTTDFWLVWSQDNEIQTLTFDATGGVYTVSFDGETSASLTYLNTSGDTAVILAALEGMSSINPGDVTVARGTPVGNVTIFTVTFVGAWAAKNVPAIAVTESLTGGSGTLVQATTQTGQGSASIDGFIYEKGGAQLHATDETEHVVIMGGTIHYADIPLPASESQTMLDLILKNGMRAKGFTIQGVAGVS